MGMRIRTDGITTKLVKYGIIREIQCPEDSGAIYPIFRVECDFTFMFGVNFIEVENGVLAATLKGVCICFKNSRVSENIESLFCNLVKKSRTKEDLLASLRGELAIEAALKKD